MARNLFLVLATLCVVFMEPSESVEDSKSFFPLDLTTVTWAHGANSQAELAKAFTDKVKMIEADMQLGTLEGGSDEIIPIMAHPPKTTSDLSFKDFITKIIESNKSQKDPKDIQGVKLDFKTIETVEPALEILQNYTSEEINFPIWLNADILQGPVNSTGTPVNATEFLRLAAEYRAGDTLSIGWTTKSPPVGETGEYSAENVKEMADLLKSQTSVDKSTPITFPLRAGLAAQSIDNVMELLKSWENSTITLWGSVDDSVDMRKLIKLIETVTKEKCFVDLPFEIDYNGTGPSSGIIASSHIFLSAFLTIIYYFV